jgi:hypothetical protein
MTGLEKMALKKLRCGASFCEAESKRVLFEPGTQENMSNVYGRVSPAKSATSNF